MAAVLVCVAAMLVCVAQLSVSQASWSHVDLRASWLSASQASSLLVCISAVLVCGSCAGVRGICVWQSYTDLRFLFVLFVIYRQNLESYG